METKNPEMRPAPAPLLGWLIAPLAVLLALAAIQIVGMDFDLNLDNMAPMLVVLVAASLGLAPRLLKASGTVSLSTSTLSLVSLVVALVGAQLVYMAGLAAVTRAALLHRHVRCSHPRHSRRIRMGERPHVRRCRCRTRLCCGRTCC